MLLEISAALARINSISTDLHRQQLHSIQLWVMTSIMYSSTKWKAHVCTPVRRSDGKKQQNLIVPTEWGNEEQIGLDMTVCEEEEEHRGRAWPCLGTGVINQKPFMKLFSVSVDRSLKGSSFITRYDPVFKCNRRLRRYATCNRFKNPHSV